jgi:hypothetical protein
MTKARKPVQRAGATRKAGGYLTIDTNDDARAVLEATAESRVAHAAWHAALRAAKKRSQRNEANSAWNVARETSRDRVRQIVERIDKQPKIQGGDLLTLALADQFDRATGAGHALARAIIRTAGGVRMKRERKGSGVTFIPSR